jgi:hypothetical protein
MSHREINLESAAVAALCINVKKAWWLMTVP